MALNAAQARQALRASGAPAVTTLTLVWPFATTSRIRALLRKRRAVLENKNQIVDYLARAQRPAAELRISRQEQLATALDQPDQRRVLLPVAVSREMIEDVLRTRAGAECGRALDQALAELIREGMLLRTSAQVGAAQQEVFYLVHLRGRPHYSLSEIEAVLQQDRGLGADLRARHRRDRGTDVSRTYRL